MAGQRALVTVVLTDAVGFTARAGHDEESALRDLNADFAIMRASAEAHGGRVVKTTGDGLLLTFDIPGQAVDCALDIQTQFASRGPDAYRHRMGVHLCEAVVEDNDVHGDGVNVAARLEAEATPGSIAISQTVYDIVKSRLGVEPRSLGARSLKNIAEPVTIFELSPTNAPKRKTSSSNAGARNWGLTLGLGGLAASILVVGGVLWAKLGNPEIKETNPTININRYQLPASSPNKSESTSRLVPKSESPAKTELVAKREAAPVSSPLSSPPVKPTVGPTNKVDPPAAPPTNPSPAPPVTANAPATSTSPETDVASFDDGSGSVVPKGIMQKQRQLVSEYDFDGVLSLLESEPLLARLPAHDRRVQKFQRLKHLRDVMDTALRAASSSSPIVATYTLEGMVTPIRVEIWGNMVTGLVVRMPNGALRNRPIRTLEPLVYRALAIETTRTQLSPREAKTLIAAFDSEYVSLARLKNTKGRTTGKKNKGEIADSSEPLNSVSNKIGE